MYKVLSDFKVRVRGKIKVVSAGSVINLPEAAAKVFVQQGKIEPVGSDPVTEEGDEHFHDTFSRVVGEMSAGYRSGFFNRARLQHPEGYSRFGACEDRITRFWGEGDFEGFRRELSGWQDIYRSLLALFERDFKEKGLGN